MTSAGFVPPVELLTAVQAPSPLSKSRANNVVGLAQGGVGVGDPVGTGDAVGLGVGVAPGGVGVGDTVGDAVGATVGVGPPPQVSAKVSMRHPFFEMLASLHMRQRKTTFCPVALGGKTTLVVIKPADEPLHA